VPEFTLAQLKKVVPKIPEFILDITGLYYLIWGCP
jgi:hypothetical protein